MAAPLRTTYPAEATARSIDRKPQPAVFAAEHFKIQRGTPMLCGRVVLADSHYGMLEGMRRIIETEAASVVMVVDEPSLIQAIDRIKPDLVIADLSFRVLGATNVARLIKSRRPVTKLIVVSIHEEPTALNEATDAGAEGFVLKRRAVVDLVTAIREVCRGGQYVSSDGPYDTLEL